MGKAARIWHGPESDYLKERSAELTPNTKPKSRLERAFDEQLERRPLVVISFFLSFFACLSKWWGTRVASGATSLWALMGHREPAQAASDIVKALGPTWLAVALFFGMVFLASFAVMVVAGKTIKWTAILFWRWKTPIFVGAVATCVIWGLIYATMATLGGIALMVVIELVHRHFKNQERIIESLEQARRDREQ